MSEEEIIEIAKSPLLESDGYERHQKSIIGLLDLYKKEKEKNMKMISENIYLKEELQKTNRYSFEIDKLKEELNEEKEKNKLLIQGKFREVADKNEYKRYVY